MRGMCDCRHGDILRSSTRGKPFHRLAMKWINVVDEIFHISICRGDCETLIILKRIIYIGNGTRGSFPTLIVH